MKLNIAGAPLAAALGLLALSAQAAQSAVIVVTYTGTVLFGQDSLGVFGAPRAFLNGDGYTAVYTINDAASGARDERDKDQSDVVGGTIYRISGVPPLSATFSINDRSVAVGGSYESFHGVCIRATCGEGSITDTAQNRGASGADYISNTLIQLITSNSTPFPSGDYRTPFTYQVQNGDVVSGQFSTSVLGPSSGIATTTFAIVSPTSVSVTLADGAPEPAAWTFFLAGFGGVGLLMRRARRAPLEPMRPRTEA